MQPDSETAIATAATAWSARRRGSDGIRQRSAMMLEPFGLMRRQDGHGRSCAEASHFRKALTLMTR
jgi:hypothetical protein